MVGRPLGQEERVMRAPNGNRLVQGTVGNDSLDFSVSLLPFQGVDYVTLGGNDKVIGTSWDDTFTLGKDAEIIDGAGGADTVIYTNSTAGVVVDLNLHVQTGGFAEGDVLVNIENVTGSKLADKLIGNASANVLDGGKGSDRISGEGGADKLLGGGGDDVLSGDADNDELRGGAGADDLSGGSGDDKLLGDAGDDVMRGGAGADTFDGGDGIDTVDYSDAPYSGPHWSFDGGVSASLLEGYGREGDAAGDTYVNVENLRGSAYEDVLEGDAHDNELLGNGGDDRIEGGAGADHLDGGDGVDFLSYGTSSAAVDVDLALNQVSGGDATGDTILNFENVIGSDHSDTILGSNDNNEIRGLDGDDTLLGRGGQDRIVGGKGIDVMAGGADSDTFVFEFALQGSDLITDYTIGVDHLEFKGSAVESVDDLQFGMGDGFAVISYFDGVEQASITLVGVDAFDLIASAQTDFLFT
jgi:Ca2+-binding RTX toxin-like protein